LGRRRAADARGSRRRAARPSARIALQYGLFCARSHHLDLTFLSGAARDRADEALMAVRLAHDLPGFLRTPLTLDAARSRVRRQLEQRERRFLQTVDRLVYGYPRSPYLQLLRHLGCERGDFHALVGREGIEGALRHLADLGVYVTFDEFKGRRPTVRGSATFTFTDRDFDSPLQRWHFFEATGGSRGRPQRLGRTLPYVADVAALVGLFYAAHGLLNPQNVFWFGANATWPLNHLKLGNTVDAWFQPIHPLPRSARYGIAYLRALAKLAGRSIPPPTHCDLLEPERITRWIVDRMGGSRPIVLNTAASSAVRVAMAATALGRSLDGVTFHCRSEPLTTARQRQIEATGAKAIADYASVELSMVGVACPNGHQADDLHLGLNRHAVVERERPVFAGGPTVRALLFTTLGITAPRVSLNAESGDVADIDRRACGCPLEALGLTTHLSNVRSFEKLSTEGTSFIRTEMLTILEEGLPARFGGTAVDYQLVEQEEADGSTSLMLRIHPGVGDLKDEDVRAAFIEDLARVSSIDAYQARLIERAASVVIQRLQPLATGAGKVLPFHLARATLAERTVRL
jgi:hypothetical protein